MNFGNYKDALEEIKMTRNCIAAGDGLLKVHTDVIEKALTHYERELAEEYRHDRLYAIALYMTPKHKWDMPEDSKPLRLLKLRYWDKGFSEFKYEQSGEKFEIYLTRWCGDTTDSEYFYVPCEWLDMEWDQLIPVMNAYMQAEWDAEKARNRASAVAQAEADLKNAQARLDALKGQ